MTPTFFTRASGFRKWLQKNHLKETGLQVGFYKVGSGKPSLTWSQAVDEALCFGWIDGVRTSIDEHSYTIRFTIRKPGSIWSLVNIKKVEILTEKGLMQHAGLASFEKRTAAKSGVYAFENGEKTLGKEFENRFKANKKAWHYFQSLAPSYRKTSIHWVVSAKQEPTRLKRLQALIADSQKETNQWKDNKYRKNYPSK